MTLGTYVHAAWNVMRVNKKQTEIQENLRNQNKFSNATVLLKAWNYLMTIKSQQAILVSVPLFDSFIVYTI